MSRVEGAVSDRQLGELGLADRRGRAGASSDIAQEPASESLDSLWEKRRVTEGADVERIRREFAGHFGAARAGGYQMAPKGGRDGTLQSTLMEPGLCVWRIRLEEAGSSGAIGRWISVVGEGPWYRVWEWAAREHREQGFAVVRVELLVWELAPGRTGADGGAVYVRGMAGLNDQPAEPGGLWSSWWGPEDWAGLVRERRSRDGLEVMP